MTHGTLHPNSRVAPSAKADGLCLSLARVFALVHARYFSQRLSTELHSLFQQAKKRLAGLRLEFRH